MTQKMASQVPFDPRHYIMGRVALPPFMSGKRQRPFVFGDDVAIANGTSGRLDIQIHDDAHFLVEAIHIISSLQTVSQDLASVQVTDTTSARVWSNVEVPLRDFAGKGDSPKYLSDPNLLRPTSTLAVQISNATGAAAQFYVALIGRKVYDVTEQEADFLSRRLWYQYALTLPVLAASSADTKASLQVYNESDFLVKKLLSQNLINAVIGAAAGAESAEVLFNLRDTTSDVSLFNKKLAARLLFGQGQGELLSTGAWSNGQGFCLKKPWLIRRNGILEGSFDNRSTAPVAVGQKLTFEGIRIFDAK